MRVLLFLFVLFFPFYFGLAHEEESAVLIAITKNGFEPSSITIKPHTKVVFINRDDVGHWPASDRHPTHSDFAGTDLEVHCSENYKGNPSFDSCRAIEAGETWSFIFEDSGTFHYHDHVWSHLSGTIIVEEERQRSRIEVWLSDFFDWANSLFVVDIDKLEKKLLDITESEDPRAAIETLRKKSSSNSSVYAVCHDLVHEIGRYSYKKYKDINIATSYQNEFCNSGYIHGVYEEYFVESQLSTTTIKELCSGAKNKFEIWQCNHGIGHGLMYKTGGDLITSLETCYSSLLSSMAGDMCQNAVYMELFNNEILLKETLFIQGTDPFKICAEMTYEKNDCYLYASTYFVKNHNWSFDAAMDLCMNLAETSKLYCIKGVVGEASRNIYELENAFALCRRFEMGNIFNECVKMAGSIVVFQTGSIEESLAMCKEAGKYEEICKVNVKKFEPMFDPIY